MWYQPCERISIIRAAAPPDHTHLSGVGIANGKLMVGTVTCLIVDIAMLRVRIL